MLDTIQAIAVASFGTSLNLAFRFNFIILITNNLQIRMLNFRPDITNFGQLSIQPFRTIN